MCPGSGGSETEPRGIINSDDLISKNGDYKNEDAVRVRGEVMLLHGFLRRFSVNGNVGRLPMQEASFPSPTPTPTPSPSPSLYIYVGVCLACVCISPFQQGMS